MELIPRVPWAISKDKFYRTPAGVLYRANILPEMRSTLDSFFYFIFESGLYYHLNKLFFSFFLEYTPYGSVKSHHLINNDYNVIIMTNIRGILLFYLSLCGICIIVLICELSYDPRWLKTMFV